MRWRECGSSVLLDSDRAFLSPFPKRQEQLVYLLSRFRDGRQADRSGDGRRPCPANGRRHAWSLSGFDLDPRIEVIENCRIDAGQTALLADRLNGSCLRLTEQPVVCAVGFHVYPSTPSDCRILRSPRSSRHRVKPLTLPLIPRTEGRT